MPDPTREALDGLVEVCNDLAEWLGADLDRVDLTVDSEVAVRAVEVADWHERLAGALADATAALTATHAVTVTCAACAGAVRVDEYHDGDDGDRVCETCCPKCQVNGAPASIPGPLEVLP